MFSYSLLYKPCIFSRFFYFVYKNRSILNFKLLIYYQSYVFILRFNQKMSKGFPTLIIYEFFYALIFFSLKYL